MIGKVSAGKVVRHKSYGTPRRAFGVKDVSRKGTPKSVALAFLKSIARELKLTPKLSELKFDKIVESPLGTHVLFQQQHNRKPISGAWIKVDIDPDNRVYNFTNNTVPSDLLAQSAKVPAAKGVSENVARQKAFTELGVTAERVRGQVHGESVAFPAGKTVVPAWKFLIPVSSPPHDWRIYIGARDGAVLHKEDMLKMVSAKAKPKATGLVFDPNPVITLNDTSLRDNKPVPDSAYRQVELKELSNKGHLDGPYVSTSITKHRVTSKNGSFSFKRNQPGFKEVMVYFHIDRMQRYIQSLGFKNVNRRPIPVNIAGLRDDNSFYSPVNKTLNFGTGGVDDAEDAEIILHEYGHSIQDDQVPGFGQSDEAGAMGEGFGDYLAASFFADSKPVRFRNCVGSWDATAYSPDDPPCLRRLDSTKHYPRDVVKEVHSDGEIWSACLWQLREIFGGKEADRLILSHHFLLSRDASFEDGAEALVQADKQLHKGAHEGAIRDIFVRRGILPSAKRKNTSYDPFARENRPQLRSRAAHA